MTGNAMTGDSYSSANCSDDTFVKTNGYFPVDWPCPFPSDAGFGFLFGPSLGAYTPPKGGKKGPAALRRV